MKWSLPFRFLKLFDPSWEHVDVYEADTEFAWRQWDHAVSQMDQITDSQWGASPEITKGKT